MLQPQVGTAHGAGELRTKWAHHSVKQGRIKSSYDGKYVKLICQQRTTGFGWLRIMQRLEKQK